MEARYKRMLEGMKKKPGRRKKEVWALYILKCGDGTFYTGIAKNIEKRFLQHSKGKGAKYTRTRLPVEVIYQESCKTRTDALVRECAVKALPRAKKEALIRSLAA